MAKGATHWHKVLCSSLIFLAAREGQQSGFERQDVRQTGGSGPNASVQLPKTKTASTARHTATISSILDYEKAL